MRPLLALVLAGSMVSSVTGGTSLHVHEYLGHDHPEHHHGIAAHNHTDVQTDAPLGIDGHHDTPDNHFEAVPCTAGRHAVSVKTACASIPHVHIDVAALPGPSCIVPAAPARSALPLTDIRVHGPPRGPRLPARAPPVSQPA